MLKLQWVEPGNDAGNSVINRHSIEEELALLESVRVGTERVLYVLQSFSVANNSTERQKQHIK